MEVDGDMARLQRQIDKVENDIDKVENAIQGGDLTPEDKQYWREKERALREEKNRLLDLKLEKERALRILQEKENKLLDLKLKNDDSSKLGHVIALLKKIVTGQRRLEKGLHASLWLTFWGDIASTVTSETTVHFRKSLVDYYGDEVDKINVNDEKLPLRCMVTNLRLPGTWITAAHLLGRKHSTKAHVFGFHDIDDPRNGLLWNRAFEEAYSYYRIVFSWDRDANSFCIHVLDKALLGQKISGIKMRKPFNRSADFFADVQTIQQFDEMTFGDLQGKLVSFNNLNRLFKRVLCLHAKLGIQKAKEEGNLSVGLDLRQYNFDYWIESTDSILLRTFLEDSQPWIQESDLEGLSTSGSADTSI